MTDKMTLADYVRELTEYHTVRTRYEYEAKGTRYATDHAVTDPPLITQLDGSVTAASQGGEVGSTVPKSSPTANLDALDAAADIDLQANRWLTDLGEPAPLETAAAIRRLHGRTASVARCPRGSAVRSQSGIVTCCTWHAIASDVRTWWTRARVLTGWDAPAWKPDNTCPLCGARRALVIRWSAGIGTCTECKETWDADNIGLLADHIRAESDERARVTSRPAPCAPTRELDTLYGPMTQCPDCGSRRCRKVLDLPQTRLRPTHA